MNLHEIADLGVKMKKSNPKRRWILINLLVLLELACFGTTTAKTRDQQNLE